MSAALLDVHALRQSFPRADGGEHLVLDGVELSLVQGQVVGLTLRQRKLDAIKHQMLAPVGAGKRLA